GTRARRSRPGPTGQKRSRWYDDRPRTATPQHRPHPGARPPSERRGAQGDRRRRRPAVRRSRPLRPPRRDRPRRGPGLGRGDLRRRARRGVLHGQHGRAGDDRAARAGRRRAVPGHRIPLLGDHRRAGRAGGHAGPERGGRAQPREPLRARGGTRPPPVRVRPRDVLPPTQGRAARRRALRLRGLDHRPASRGHRPPRRRRDRGVGLQALDDQDQPTGGLDARAGPRLRGRARLPAQPAARRRLPVDRLRAVHATRRGRRGRARRPLGRLVQDRMRYPPVTSALASPAPAPALDGLPLTVGLSAREVLLVGGGPVSARRARTFLEAGALVRVVAPELAPEMESLAARAGGAVVVVPRAFTPDDLDTPWMVHVATGDPEGDAEAAALCERQRIWGVTAGDAARGSAPAPARPAGSTPSGPGPLAGAARSGSAATWRGPWPPRPPACVPAVVRTSGGPPSWATAMTATCSPSARAASSTRPTCWSSTARRIPVCSRNSTTTSRWPRSARR